MLTGSRKQDLREMTDLLKGMDSIGMMILKSNATALLARQKLAESRLNKKEVRQLTIMDYDSENSISVKNG